MFQAARGGQAALAWALAAHLQLWAAAPAAAQVTAEVPADSVAALRAAFDATMRDREFLAEFAPMGLDVEPLTGEALQKLVQDVAAIPSDLVARAKTVYGK